MCPDNAGMPEVTSHTCRSSSRVTAGTARIALPYALAASTEIELVVPDHDKGLGRVWPWGLVSVSRSWRGWHAALAVEAQASPEDRSRVDVLAQLGKAWGFK